MRADSPPGSPLRTSWRNEGHEAGLGYQRGPQLAYNSRPTDQPYRQPVFGGHLPSTEATSSVPSLIPALGAVSSNGFTFPARAPPVMEQISGRSSPSVVSSWPAPPPVVVHPQVVRQSGPCTWWQPQPVEQVVQPPVPTVFVTETAPPDNGKSMTLLNRLDSVIAEMEMVLAPGRLAVPEEYQTVPAEYRTLPVPVEYRPVMVRDNSPVPQSAYLQDPSRRSRSQEMRSAARTPGLYMETTSSRSASTPPRQEAQQLGMSRLSEDGRKAHLTELKSIIAKCRSLSGSAVAPPEDPIARSRPGGHELSPARTSHECTPLLRQRVGAADSCQARPSAYPDYDRRQGGLDRGGNAANLLEELHSFHQEQLHDATVQVEQSQRSEPAGERSGSATGLVQQLQSFHQEHLHDVADGAALQVERVHVAELQVELDEAKRRAHEVQVRCVEEEASQEAALSARLYAWEAKAATLQHKCDLVQKQEAEASREMSDMRRVGLDAESRWSEAQTTISVLRAEVDAANRRAKVEETSQVEMFQRELSEAQRQGSAVQAEAMAEKDRLLAYGDKEKKELLDRIFASEGAVQSLQVQVAEAVDRASLAQTAFAQKDLDLVAAAEQEETMLQRLTEQTAKVAMLEAQLSEAQRRGSVARTEVVAQRDQLIADAEREKKQLLERALASEGAVQSLQVQVAEAVDRASLAQTDLAQKDLDLVTAAEQEQTMLQRLSEETFKVEMLELELANARRLGGAAEEEALAEKDKLIAEAGREKEVLLSRLRASEGTIQGLQLEVEGALDQSGVAQRALAQKDQDLLAAAEQEQKVLQRLSGEAAKVEMLELELTEARHQDSLAKEEALAEREQLLVDAGREKEVLLGSISEREEAIQSLQVEVAGALDQRSVAQRALAQKDVDLGTAVEQEEKLLQQLRQEMAKVELFQHELSEAQHQGNAAQEEAMAEKDRRIANASQEKKEMLERILSSEGAVQSLQVEVAEALDQGSGAQRELARKDEAQAEAVAQKDEQIAELTAAADQEKNELLERTLASEGAVQSLQVQVAEALERTSVAQRDLSQKDLNLVAAAEQEEKLLARVELLELELAEALRQDNAAKEEALAQKDQQIADAGQEKEVLLGRIRASQGAIQGLQVEVAGALDQSTAAQKELAQKDRDLLAATELEQTVLRRLSEETAKVKGLELELAEAQREDIAAKAEALAEKDQLMGSIQGLQVEVAGAVDQSNLAQRELAQKGLDLLAAAEQEEKLLKQLTDEAARVEVLELKLADMQRQDHAAQAEVLAERDQQILSAEREKEELLERVLATDGTVQSLQLEMAEARDQRQGALQDLAQKDFDLVAAAEQEEKLLKRISDEVAEVAALRLEMSEAQLDDSAQQAALAERDLLIAGAQREKDELLERIVAGDGAVRQLEDLLAQKDLDMAGATAAQEEKLMQLVTEEAATVELAQIELLEAQRQDRQSQQEAGTLRVELAEALAQRDRSRRESRARNSTAAELALDTSEMQSQIAQLTEMLREQNEDKKSLQAEIARVSAAKDESDMSTETKAATFDAEYAAMLAEGMKKDAQLMRQQTELAEYRSRAADLAVQQARMSRATRLSAIDHGYFDEGDMHQIPIPAMKVDPLDRGSQAGASSVRSSRAEDLGVYEDAQLVSLQPPRPSTFNGLQQEQIRSSFSQGSSFQHRGTPGGASVGAISGNMSDDGSETWDTGAEDLAIPEAYLEVIKQVDEYGWDSMEWSHGYTLLHWAAKNNYGSLCVRFMSQKADPELRDDRGESAMDYAAEFGSRRALAHLEKGSISLPADGLRPIDPLMTVSHTRGSMQVLANPSGSRVIPGAVHFEDLTRASAIQTSAPLPTVEAVDD